jgi:CheY-like chemotaxis protein
LGRSQVYGFVKQSNGYVKIYSEVGHGTTVKLYLPRFFVAESLTLESHSGAGSIPTIVTGYETIMVVEDEDRVRRTTIESVRELGYTVLDADGAAAALRIIDSHPEVKLVFTDIVMPEVDGRRFAEEALRRRPGLRVLYTTGYTRNAIVHNGVLDPGVQLLSKPYTLEQLALNLREVLDTPVAASGTGPHDRADA